MASIVTNMVDELAWEFVAMGGTTSFVNAKLCVLFNTRAAFDSIAAPPPSPSPLSSYASCSRSHLLPSLF